MMFLKGSNKYTPLLQALFQKHEFVKTNHFCFTMSGLKFTLPL